MRTQNIWDITTQEELSDLVNDKGIEDVADALDVSIRTIRTWIKGNRAPNRRYQMAIMAMSADFKNMNADNFGCMFRSFLEINDVDTDWLAQFLGVSEQTAQAYVDGRRKPRAWRKAAALMKIPTPALR